MTCEDIPHSISVVILDKKDIKRISRYRKTNASLIKEVKSKFLKHLQITHKLKFTS